MPRLDETILEYIKRRGPSTPIEITKGVGASSIIVSAILVDATHQRKLLSSKKHVCSTRLYYFPEQKKALENRVASVLTPKDRELLQKVAKEQVVCEYELRPEEVTIMSQLEDLIGSFMVEYNNLRFKCWHIPEFTEEKAKKVLENKLVESSRSIEILMAAPQKLTESEKFLQQKAIELGKTSDVVKLDIPKVEPKVEKKPEPKIEVETRPKPKASVGPAEQSSAREPKTEKKAAKPKGKQKKLIEEPEEKVPRDEFMNKVMGWLEKENIEVLREHTVKGGKVYDLEAKVPTVVGKQHYLVRVLNYGKKKVSQSDVSTVGTDAAAQRTPAIIISATGFAKSATKYWKKELEDSVILVGKDDME